MDQEKIAELYLSFSAIFHRPNPEVANHLEELVEFWSEVVPDVGELIHTLRSFCHQFPPGELRLSALWEHYIPLFETGDVEAIPYASVYFGKDGLVLGEEAFKVNQFYKRCGLEIEESRELPDHLAVELEFCALLVGNGKGQELAEFVKDHLAPFLNHILPRIKASGRPVYSEVATILSTIQPNLQKVGDFLD
jgi:putative dimethyl sulfoxide reductase chaperone